MAKQSKNVNDKRFLKTVFDRFIERQIQDLEVWQSHYEPKNRGIHEEEIDGTSLYLSNLTDALATNDYHDVIEEADRFIDTEFSSSGLDKDSPTYKFIVREYLKAKAYCVRLHINHMSGVYERDEIVNWMPDHLTKLNKFAVNIGQSSYDFTRPPGRPGLNYDAIIEELNSLHNEGQTKEDGQAKYKKRIKICKELSDWYKQNYSRHVPADSLRKKLKPVFDELGI